MATHKNQLNGNENIEGLKRAIERAIPDEDEGTKVKPLTAEDILNALWILADQVEQLEYLRNHTHATETVNVIVPGNSS